MKWIPFVIYGLCWISAWWANRDITRCIHVVADLDIHKVETTTSSSSSFVIPIGTK